MQYVKTLGAHTIDVMAGGEEATFSPERLYGRKRMGQLYEQGS